MGYKTRLWLAKKAVRQGAEIAADLLGLGAEQRAALCCHVTALVDAHAARCPTAPAAEPDDEDDYCDLGTPPRSPGG